MFTCLACSTTVFSFSTLMALRAYLVHMLPVSIVAISLDVRGVIGYP